MHTFPQKIRAPSKSKHKLVYPLKLYLCEYLLELARFDNVTYPPPVMMEHMQLNWTIGIQVRFKIAVRVKFKQEGLGHTAYLFNMKIYFLWFQDMQNFNRRVY